MDFDQITSPCIRINVFNASDGDEYASFARKHFADIVLQSDTRWRRISESTWYPIPWTLT